MRRARGGFAWVSMMDLLFGLFGALVIMTMLITLKLGRDPGVEARAFQLIVLEAESSVKEVAEALQRMSLGFRITRPNTCQFGASFENESCADKVSKLRQETQNLSQKPLVNFRTAASPMLSATLFVGDKGDLALEPFLANTPAFQDLSADALDQEVTFRINVKSGDRFWAPGPFCVPLRDLIDLANQHEQGLTPLDFCKLSRCDGQNYDETICSNKVSTEGGSLVLQ